ncbi:hypothetical protein BDN72DRAFT_940089 [Pluteus cervinus]|uniref:Uncharacterized protein n=1 Tax=Pluteus cervinus TaxID=181527 RepID=A0ACD3A4C8_9AGAR|nr:hypothetical protein BDN72DRAFT_940089 [Pluteus cervinus]
MASGMPGAAMAHSTKSADPFHQVLSTFVLNPGIVGPQSGVPSENSADLRHRQDDLRSRSLMPTMIRCWKGNHLSTVSILTPRRFVFEITLPAAAVNPIGKPPTIAGLCSRTYQEPGVPIHLTNLCWKSRVHPLDVQNHSPVRYGYDSIDVQQHLADLCSRPSLHFALAVGTGKNAISGPVHELRRGMFLAQVWLCTAGCTSFWLYVRTRLVPDGSPYISPETRLVRANALSVKSSSYGVREISQKVFTFVGTDIWKIQMNPERFGLDFDEVGGFLIGHLGRRTHHQRSTQEADQIPLDGTYFDAVSIVEDPVIFSVRIQGIRDSKFEQK